MRRRGLLNLALLLAVVGLLGLLLWDNSKPAAAPKPITSLAEAAIDRITIEYPDAATLRLEKTDAGWRMTAPVEGRAETSEVKQILKLATAPASRSYPADEIEAEQVGLAKPGYRVKLNDVEIALGANDPLERTRYAQVGNKVYLIKEPNLLALDADYSNLLARDLLPENTELTRLELPNNLSLERSDTGGWTVQPQDQDRGADAAQKTVDAWQAARALWVKPGIEQQTAQSVVRLHTEGGTTHTFEVVAREPQLILRRPDQKANYHVAVNQAGPMLEMRHNANSDDQPPPLAGQAAPAPGR